jgi:hypothetical protein
MCRSLLLLAPGVAAFYVYNRSEDLNPWLAVCGRSSLCAACSVSSLHVHGCSLLVVYMFRCCYIVATCCYMLLLCFSPLLHRLSVSFGSLDFSCVCSSTIISTEKFSFSKNSSNVIGLVAAQRKSGRCTFWIYSVIVQACPLY